MSDQFTATEGTFGTLSLAPWFGGVGTHIGNALGTAATNPNTGGAPMPMGFTPLSGAAQGAHNAAKEPREGTAGEGGVAPAAEMAETNTGSSDISVATLLPVSC